MYDQIENSLIQLSTGTENPEGYDPAPDIVQSNPISFPSMSDVTLENYRGRSDTNTWVWALMALKFVAECGTDMNHWPDASILPRGYVCPREIRFPVEKCCLENETVIQSNCCCTQAGSHTIGRSDTALGAFYHRLSSRIGKQKQSLQRQENWRYCSTMPEIWSIICRSWC